MLAMAEIGPTSACIMAVRQLQISSSGRYFACPAHKLMLMKTTWSFTPKRLALKLCLASLTAACGLAILRATPAIAQAAQPANAVAVTNAVATATNPSNQPPAVALSPGIAEILKLADAGVSADIILTYVESSPAGPQPTEIDIIALKEHKVPDEVVKLLLRRSATARNEATKARNEAVLQVVESRRAVTGGLDPESYDYFRAYHLQPRAVASANQRLYPHAGPYAPRGYGYGPVFTYGVPLAGRPGYPVYHGGFR
jgi:hypothetical protein